MQGFLYIHLAASTSVYPYGQPLLTWVKQTYPAAATLDVDAQSDELLQHYALRLLRESEQTLICFDAADATAVISKLMPLLEESFQPEKKRLVILHGQHPRLQRIFEARPFLQFISVEEEELVKEAVKNFFS